MSSGNSWADQWGSHNDYESDQSNLNGGGKENNKMAEINKKVKVVASTGLEKAKTAASVGAQKVKSGTTTGIKWIKNQYHKRTSK